jgi:hypothetical protein
MKAMAFTTAIHSSGSSAPAAEVSQHTYSSNILPSFRRHRALVLDSSYRPIDIVNWQRAICLDLFDKVTCRAGLTY